MSRKKQALLVNAFYTVLSNENRETAWSASRFDYYHFTYSFVITAPHLISRLFAWYSAPVTGVKAGRIYPPPSSDIAVSKLNKSVSAVLNRKKHLYSDMHSSYRGVFLHGTAERFRCTAPQAQNRKKLVANQRRYEGVYNRIADVCVTFCEKGGAAAWANSDFCKKIRASDIKLAPTCKSWTVWMQLVFKQNRHCDFAPYFFTITYYLLPSKNRQELFKGIRNSE